MFDRAVRYHLDYATLRQHTDDLHAERIVLTHMSPHMSHEACSSWQEALLPPERPSRRMAASARR